MSSKVYIVEAARLPIGKYGGMYSDVGPEELGGFLMKTMLDKHPGLNEHIDEVIVGNVIGGGGNVARRVALKAGLPVETPAVTVDRQCASGLEAIAIGHMKIMSGFGEIMICGGVESSSRAPWQIERPKSLYGMQPPQILTRQPLSSAEYGDPDMGAAAEELADKYGITRQQQDEFALQSQLKYQASKRAGVFHSEITPFRINDELLLSEDECPRSRSSLESLNRLKPVFKANGTITAGNCCPVNDGASFTILASEHACRLYHLTPIAQVVDAVAVGVDPNDFGLGPVPAVEKLLVRQQLTLEDINVIELNEAFAVQALACIKLGNFPIEKINPSGGATAFGHPYGATGAILVTRLLTELNRNESNRCGIVTMCVGGGQGAAILIRKAGPIDGEQ